MFKWLNFSMNKDHTLRACKQNGSKRYNRSKNTSKTCRLKSKDLCNLRSFIDYHSPISSVS
jgi:hypothetical protein